MHNPQLEDVSLQEILKKLCDFTMRGGKRIRSALLYYCYQGFSDSDGLITLPLGIACELMQSLMLIHDDIMDEGIIRRGGKTMHCEFSNIVNDSHYGKSMAILVGNIAGFMGINVIGQLETDDKIKLQLMQLYVKTCIEVGYGQALDILPLSKDNLSEETIYDIYGYKTASYTTIFPLLSAALLAKQEEDVFIIIKKLGKSIGILFQIRDDILGIFADPSTSDKTVTSDFKQGKKTLLIYKALQAATPEQRNYLIKAYGNPTIKFEEISEIQNIIRGTGSLEHSIDIMGKYADQARKLIGPLNLKNEAKIFILQLIDWLQMVKI